ncbi:hypothetical protein ABVK25_004936 [Lepraria finkii]|uniref:Uncharacterized protein n=1 Tax=Lepraria finkii TaxID=1340010 RepID=A0ABR4BB38_9LECA
MINAAFKSRHDLSDHAPEGWTNESSPLLWGSMVYGTPQRVRYPSRPRYIRPSQLQDIEEGELTTDDAQRKGLVRQGLLSIAMLGTFALIVWAAFVFSFS